MRIKVQEMQRPNFRLKAKSELIAIGYPTTTCRSTFFILMLLICTTGCQISLMGLNKSGSEEQSVEDASQDYKAGKAKFLVSLRSDSEQFQLLQDALIPYGVALHEYFPESSNEKDYMQCYNKSMNSLLENKYGLDVYDRCYQEIDKTTYFKGGSADMELD